MQITNAQAIQIIDAVNEIQQKDIPIKLAYQFYHNLSQVNERYMTYIKTLNNMLEKEGVEDADDPKVRDKTLELLNMTIDVDIDPIDKQELIDTGIELTLSQLVRLNPIIEEK